MRKVYVIVLTTLFFILPASQRPSYSQSMTDYCYIPPFVGINTPPLVMLVVGRDHRLYYEAYNDASDLNEDGRIDTGYTHTINYYGYFDPYKCYRYEGSGANAKFVPTRRTENKYCGGNGEWSGNFLNWLTMSRMDVLRKALYGGYRSTDSASETVLEATYIPQDAHSWGKEYAGPDTRLLTPFSAPESGRRHLFCITSTRVDETRRIRVALNDQHRIWEWASTERAVCSGPDTPDGWRRGPVGTRRDIQDYFIRVRVCDSSVGLETNCKRYPGGTYKPIGLLQKYGEGDGTKICSKSFRTCNSDADCTPHAVNGLCLDRAKMYFGLLTGTYINNLNGGVLRKNIWTLLDEINSNTGIFQTSENVEGNILLTFNRLTTIGFRYSDYSYQDASGGNCGWITTRPINQGECRMWGNPVAEMMYEALRYLAGRASSTSSFSYSGTQDSGLNLPKPDWGIRRGNVFYRPYELFPICSKPFLLVISDINNNYDSDSVPGSSFNAFNGDLTGLNVTSLANTVSSVEGISGNYFIGQSGGLYDFICSAKNVSSLANIRGLCPEEPTKQGSFYPASIAYYGNSGWRNNFSGARPPNVKTYSVALASPIPDIAVKVGANTVRITPMAKSVSGCLNVYNACASKCTFRRDEGGNFIISNCQADSYCPTNQIVDFYVDTLSYDAGNNLTYAKFRINFEDVEQGADHDMDAIVEYEVRPVGTNRIEVTLRSTYAAGCIDHVLGFTISGTTEDGTWLVVRDRDSATDDDTPSIVGSMPLIWSRTFIVTGNPAGQLKPPLWYAAKWGSFDDNNNNGVPDLPQEWDRDGNGNPDTYFFVANPLRLEEELERAFSEMLRRASSGATVATLTSRTNVSSVVLQPYFYPRYIRPDGVEVSWIGFLRSFWVDTKQNMREDTNTNKILDLAGAVFDRVFQLVFDTQSNETRAMVLSVPDPETSCSLGGSMSVNQLKPVFDGGCRLAQEDASSRKIFYNRNGTLAEFNTSESSSLRPVWQSIDGSLSNDTLVGCLIRYIRGENVSGDSSCAPILSLVQRAREFDSATLNNICPSYNFSTGRTWKLGDIIYSTPSVVSSEPVNAYHLRYNDDTYLDYIRRSSYRRRSSFIFVSANDGMLHAFRLGHIRERKVCSNDTGRECQTAADCPAGGFCIPDPNNPVKLINSPTNNSTDLIAREEWAFIPRNAIPYLVWYGRQDYCHVPTVDYRTIVRDVSIGGPASSRKDANSWRTILVGTMGFGGKYIRAGANTYSSSVFALDLTDWLNGGSDRPILLWEVSIPDNTLALSFPAIIRQGDPNSNGDWYVVVGTGPREAGDKPGVGGAEDYLNTTKLYIINLRDGRIVRTVDLNLPSGVKAAVGDIKVVDVESDYQDDVMYFGLYGKDGSNSWGSYRRLPLRQGSSYMAVGGISSADISEAIDLGTFATGNHRPPVFGGSTFTRDENGNLWVFFGTGKLLSSLDKALPYDNYLVGFKDDCWKGTCSTTYNRSQLTDTTGSTTTARITETRNMCVCDTSTCQNRAVAYETTSNVDPSQVARGWYYRLVREAIYSEPVIFGGIVDALTFVPPEDVCEIEGNSNLIALYYKTGRPNPRPAILSPAAVSGNIGVGQSINVLSKVSLGRGVPPIGAPFQIAMGASQTRQYEKFVQLSSGVVLRITQQTVPAAEGRFILWIEK